MCFIIQNATPYYHLPKKPNLPKSRIAFGSRRIAWCSMLICEALVDEMVVVVEDEYEGIVIGVE